MEVFVRDSCKSRDGSTVGLRSISSAPAVCDHPHAGSGPHGVARPEFFLFRVVGRHQSMKFHESRRSV